MVRSIKHCSVCNSRFVSHGTGKKKKVYLCPRCSAAKSIQSEKGTGDGLLDSSSSSCLKYRKIAFGKENNHRISPSTLDTVPKTVVVRTRDPTEELVSLESSSICIDIDDNDSCGGGSEGGDDVYCTQILESQHSFEEQDDFQEGESPAVSRGLLVPIDGTTTVAAANAQAPPLPISDCDGAKPEPEPTLQLAPPPTNRKLFSNDEKPPAAANTAQRKLPSSTSGNGGDICFICGANLSRLKRRIDHIKRCSKKHGITGRDVRVVPQESAAAAFHEASSSPKPAQNSEKDAKGTQRDPTESSSQWHGDAQALLKLTKQEECQNVLPIARGSTTATASGYNPQTGKFQFQVPSATRNLNNVLMAGSRRLEVMAKAASKRGEIERGSDATGKPKRSRYDNWNCPLYKKITGTDFVVDGFHYAKQSLTKNYFLTHFHSDHYGGITSSWDVGTIFCSLPTASLVSQQLRVDKKHIHPLPMNTPTVVESRGKAVTVTLLDANHCPGAVMLLFQVGKRTILHVGDFRWSRDAMLLQQPSSPLHAIVNQSVALDELYLDTTYCHEKYQLPPQSDTIQATIETFEKELERCRNSNPPKRTLHLFGAYTIGKEKIYLSVAERFGLKVYVDKSRHKILSTLNLPEKYTKLLTTNREMSDLWVVPMGHLNMKKMPDYFSIANSKPFAPAYHRIVGYRPTGWSLSRSGIISSRNSGKLTIHSVPYSEHSSFPELVDCLEHLKPAKIIPTVSASKSNEQVKLLLQGLRNKQAALKMFSNKK